MEQIIYYVDACNDSNCIIWSWAFFYVHRINSPSNMLPEVYQYNVLFTLWHAEAGNIWKVTHATLIFACSKKIVVIVEYF